MSTPVLTPLSTDMPQPDATTHALAVTGLGKTYELRPVLRNISFTLPRGRTLALLGANGAGKTTLLRILATLAKPSSGQVAVMGLDVRSDAGEVRRCVGYVGHQPHIYDDLTARENLLFFARMYGMHDGAARADALLEWVGLRARANDRAGAFSRGQAQRLALARGILHKPQVLLLDEPDTGLDDEAADLLGGLLAERTAAGMTTIFTTHNIERGLASGTDVLVLASGRVVFAGPPAELTADRVRGLYGRSAR